MTARNRGEPKFPLPLLLLFFTVSVLMLDALTSYAKSAGEILSDYGRPPDKRRESIVRLAQLGMSIPTISSTVIF